ncbi:MAG: DUF417 family protein [Planctomycetia bacterium]|nr:DUF417 family protein [Planctomycetia bacterium]
MNLFSNHWCALGFAVAAFGICQLLPAFTLAGDSMVGWQATFLSFVGTYEIPSQAGSDSPARGQLAACMCGAAANTLFVVGIGAMAFRRHSAVAWIGRITVVMAVASVVFLLTGSETFMPNIGCFVWLMAMATPVLTARYSFRATENAVAA